MNDPWLLEMQDGPSSAPPAISPLRVLLDRKWLIILCTILAGSMGYLYYTKTVPIYESSAQVLLIDNTKRNLTQAVEFSRGYEDSLTDQALIVQSPLVISAAVDAENLDSLDTFRGSGDVVGAIRSGLIVGPAKLYGASSAQNTLEFRFQGPYPEDCAVVVQAVVDSYQSFLGTTQRNISQETSDLITEAKENLLRKLESEEQAYQDFLKEAPVYLTIAGSVNPYAEHIARLEAAKSELAISRARQNSALRVLEQAKESGTSREASILLAKEALGSPAEIPTEVAQAQEEDTKRPLQQMLDKLLIDESVMLKDFGVDHPDVVSLRNRIAAVRKLVDQGKAAAVSVGTDNNSDPLTVYTEALHQRLAAEKEREAELEQLLQQEQKNAKEFSIFLTRGEAFRGEIARLQNLFDEVVRQLEQISLVDNYGGYETQVLTPPQIGGKVKPVLAIVMLASCAIGLASGIGLAYILELADQNVRTPDEIPGLLGTPVVGLIPVLAVPKRLGKVPEIAISIVAHHRPKSRQAEAYRAVRAALFFNARGQQHQVIQVTSPQAGDGKSTLAANLAVSIAQSGRRVLLLDADFRRPTIHKLFGLPNQDGVSSILAGVAELDEAIQTSDTENLDVLPCGPLPANPAELALSGQLRDLLELLKSKYDFVIVDTPPILAVTDPLALAVRADGVLMTMRMGKTTRGQLKQAYESLQSVDANVLGLVVNAIDPNQGGYGNYRYNYGDKSSTYFDPEPQVAINGEVHGQKNGTRRALTVR